MKHFIYTALVICAALTAAGCQSDLELDGALGGGGTIAFNPSLNVTSNVTETKVGNIGSADGSFEIPLFCTVEDGIADQVRNDGMARNDGMVRYDGMARNDGMVRYDGMVRNDGARHAELTQERHAELDSASPETKGTQLYPSGDDPAALGSYWTGSFFVRAYDGTAQFIPASGSDFDEVTYSNSIWAVTGKEYKWTKGKDITFFAYANVPSSIATISDTNTSLTLTYSSVPTAAADQKDIIMGYYKGQGSEDKVNKKRNADIVFHHPMAAVRFAAGDFGDDVTVNFKKITLEGVYDGGIAVMDGTSAAQSDPGDRFTWDTSSSSMQSVVLDGGSSNLTVATSGTDKIIGEPFILVPQDLSSNNVKIVVVAVIDGVETTLSTELKTDSWVSGKTYTYLLSKKMNYSYNFTFDSPDNYKTVASRMYDQNATSSQSMTVDIVSTKAREDKPDVLMDQDWKIKSYRIGTGSEQTVGGSSFTDDAFGIEVTSSGNRITVKAAERTKLGKGTNGYWTNSDSRTDDLLWSPADWSLTTSSNPVDLSRYNYQTDTPDDFEMTTANCYIIRHAGTYKLPLVYGNAMLNGNYNVQSYYPAGAATSWSNSSAANAYDNGTKSEGPSSPGSSSSSDDIRLVCFLNYNGGEISSPYIETDCGTTASGAKILWQSEAEVIDKTSLSLFSGGSGAPRYLQFTVDQDKICQSNSVIAIYDSAGKIMWSWQIWTTNDPAILDGPIRVLNYDDQPYDFLPVTNIGFIEGWTYKGRDDLVITLIQDGSDAEIELTIEQPEIPSDGNSSIYQYGRKDPMSYRESDAAYMDDSLDGEAITIVDPYDTDRYETDGTMVADKGPAYAIQHPTHYVRFERGFIDERWTAKPYRNLWSGINVYQGAWNQSEATGAKQLIKTVYDPSPIGYKVPAGRCFTGFTTTGDNLYTVSASKQNKINGYVAPNGNGIYFYRKMGANHSVNTGGKTILFKLSGMRVGLTGQIRKWESMYYTSNTERYEEVCPFIMCFTTEKKPSSIDFLSPISSAASNGISVRPVIDVTWSGNPFNTATDDF